MATGEEIVNFVRLTDRHRELVRGNLEACIQELGHRAVEHDQSKLEEPEISGYAEHISRLQAVEYDSTEYHQILEDMGPTLQHHYAVNSHHPEHYENGINDMSLFDIIEMISDWEAAASNKNKDIHEIVEHNLNRYNVSEPLRSIILRSASVFLEPMESGPEKAEE